MNNTGNAPTGPRRIRIAHVLPALLSGGAQRVAVELVRHAALEGHEVTLVLAHRTDMEAPLLGRLPETVRVEYISPSVGGRLSRYVFVAGWLWRRRHWLAELDVLHCHLTYSAIIGTLVHSARRIRGSARPIVVETYHAVGMPISAFARRRDAWMARHRDAFVLMANAERFWMDFIAAHPERHVPTILNGAVEPRVDDVDAEARTAYRRSLGIPDDHRCIVGTVSRLSADRNPALYIPVFAEVVRQLGLGVHFVFAGGGPERGHLERLAAEGGFADRVHFTGDVKEPRFPLAIMDAYLTSNVGPVTGVAALEAALAGRPVVAVQLVADYIPTGAEWIFASADPVVLGQRIAALLRDDRERRAVIEQQRDYARSHHTVDVMGRAYEDLYERLLDRPGPPSA